MTVLWQWHCTQSTVSINLTSAANGHQSHYWSNISYSNGYRPAQHSDTLTKAMAFNRAPLLSSAKNGPRNLLTSNRTRGTASTCGPGSSGLRLRRNKSDLYDTHKRRGNLRQLCVVLLYQRCTQLQIPINEKDKIAYIYFLDGRASRRPTPQSRGSFSHGLSLLFRCSSHGTALSEANASDSC